jgi:hypothetical protein
MVRESVRRHERLRVWRSANGPLGEAADGITVEWAGKR